MLRAVYGRKETIMKAIHIKLTTIEDVYTLVKILMAFDSEVVSRKNDHYKLL